MATFEEKILAYLDGSLPAEGRDELIASMSGNSARAAEHRALFDQHIRMADLMTLAQTPVSAPLSIQRDLASKVPVLAMKLPYLASERRNQEPIAAGWLSQSRSSYIGAILVVALALITGCVWFALNQKNTTPSGDAQSQTASNSNTSVQSSGASSVTSSQNSAQNISPSNPNTNGDGVDGNVAANSGNSKKVEVSHPHRPDRSASAISSGFAEQDNQANNALAKPADQIPASGNSPEDTKIELHSAQIPPSSPAAIIGSGSTMHSLSALNEREENNNPVRVFAAEEYRFIRLSPQQALSDFSRNNGLENSTLGFESPEFGIDYALDPWISIGLRGGDARFVQEQAVTTQSNPTPGYPISREVRETILLDPFAAWFGPAITYSLSASESANFTGTLAVGDALVTALAGAISPIVRGEFAFLYDLTNTFALRLAASYETDWTPSATPINITPSNSISGVVVGSNVATHESQVFGISLGVSFHP
jgi:hypothetical protein